MKHSDLILYGFKTQAFHQQPGMFESFLELCDPIILLFCGWAQIEITPLRRDYTLYNNCSYLTRGSKITNFTAVYVCKLLKKRVKRKKTSGYAKKKDM